jgi:hypothetical protein
MISNDLHVPLLGHMVCAADGEVDEDTRMTLQIPPTSYCGASTASPSAVMRCISYCWPGLCGPRVAYESVTPAPTGDALLLWRDMKYLGVCRSPGDYIIDLDQFDYMVIPQVPSRRSEGRGTYSYQHHS